MAVETIGRNNSSRLGRLRLDIDIEGDPSYVVQSIGMLMSSFRPDPTCEGDRQGS